MAFLNVTVEVPLLLVFISFMLTGSVYTNLIIYRTCYLTLGFNKTECALLGTLYNNDTEKLEKLVEPQAAIINMARSTTESVFTVILCLMIGPWSDKFGRKPVIILNLLGNIMTFLAISVFSYFPNISPWYSIICSIPILITGGAASYLTVILSYITDVTTEETRGLRMAVFEAVLAGGILMGSVSSSYIFYATNYTSVFAIAAGLCVLGVIYTIFCIPESVQNRETQGKLTEFFQISNILDMVKATLKKRENFNRAIIILNVVILTIYIFTMTGDGSVMFLYLREKFDWTLTAFTLYNSATSVAWIIGTMGGTFILHKILHINESKLILLGFVSTLVGALLLGLGHNNWYIYAAGAVRCLGGIVSPMSRLLVSKLVPVEEIGKIFSMIMASEFALGLAASPLYTAVYDATINSNPGVFQYVTAGFHTCDICLTIGIIVLQGLNNPAYTQLNNGEPEAAENRPANPN